jgi:DNA polymerase-3 subunit epsilon
MDFSIDLDQPWKDLTFVAFDLETSGAYPLGSDIIEFGAVKWARGQEVNTFQTLLRPREPMTAFNMGIHGITNEMVANAPLMKDRIQEIDQFLQGSVVVAHHAPFDMGFLVCDFEAHQMPLPKNPVVCTSLLARKMIPESPNHKLQTLIKVLNLVGGQAHRGLDDARACLQLGVLCMERVGSNASLKEVLSKMGKDLLWSKYSIRHGGTQKIEIAAEALSGGKSLDLVYEGGSIKGTRRVQPQGIVRNPDGDYLQGICQIDRISKRFYFNKIKDIQIVY